MATVTHAAPTTACRWPGMDAIEGNMRQARRVVNAARRGAEDAVADAALHVRRHPLQAVGAAAIVGAITGALVGFGTGWLTRRSRWEC